MFDHILETTPKTGPDFGMAMSRANARASSLSTEFVDRKRNIIDKLDIMKEYKNVVKSSTKGDIGDLNRYWLYYMNKK